MGVYSLKHIDQLVFMSSALLCTGTKLNGLSYLFFRYTLRTTFSFPFVLSILIEVLQSALIYELVTDICGS